MGSCFRWQVKKSAETDIGKPRHKTPVAEQSRSETFPSVVPFTDFGAELYLTRNKRFTLWFSIKWKSHLKHSLILNMTKHYFLSRLPSAQKASNLTKENAGNLTGKLNLRKRQWLKLFNYKLQQFLKEWT